MQDDRLTRAAFLRQLAFLAAGAAVPALLGDDAARAEDTPAQAPAPAGGTVDFALQVDVAKRGERLGARFLGLSYEAVALAGGGRNRSPFRGDNADLVGFLRLLGPGVLRFGGNSVERTFWTHAEAAPRSVTLLPEDLKALAGLLQNADQQLILGVNLGRGTADDAANEVNQARRVFGSRLRAIEIGNEPDLYRKNGLRTPDYDYKAFRAEWDAFVNAIQLRAPGTAIAGPAAAGSYNKWAIPLAQDPNPALGLITQHDYTEGPGSDPKVTIERMLTRRPKMEADFAALVAAGKARGLPVRMGEANSVYSGGRAGVSDTFASALWALDYCLQLASMGADGINFHGGGTGSYSPITFPRDGHLSVRPIYYGMLAIAQIGTGQMIDIAPTGSALPEHVYAHALRGDDGKLRLVLINAQTGSGTVRFKIAGIDGGDAKAGVLRLEGKSLDATTDVRLGGAAVGDAGAWTPTAAETVTAMAGVLTVTVPAPGAAIVTVG